jgi:endonuclease VIII
VPEGDTIRRLADRLAAAAAGRTIRRSVLRHNAYATADLSGLVLAQVDAAGKHLLMRLADRGGRHRLTVHSHLRMSGSWTLGVPRATPTWRRRVELWMDAGPPLVGTDLPVLDIGPPRAERGWIGHLGPDLCAADFDPDRAVANLSAAGGTPLGAALLDQRLLAGIGNLYAVELPFVVGVSPWTPAAEVAGLDLLVAIARAVLPVNARLGPQTTTGLVGRGREHWIYGRRGRPCPVCRAPLEVAEERDVPWGRVTTWCPGCQVARTADGRRAARLL